MLRKTSYLLALVLLCGVGQAGISVADGPRFIGRLPQGTVELVGVTNCPPTTQSKWWRPDGSAEKVRLLRSPKAPHVPVTADTKAITFLFRFENLPADACHWAVWEINPSGGSLNWDGPWDATYVSLAGRNRDVSRCEILSASRSISDQTADIRVGISKGPWQTVTTHDARGADTKTFIRDGNEWTVTIREATAHASGGGTQVKLTTSELYGRFDTRLLAVAGDGSEHSRLIGYYGQNGKTDFPGLALSSIKEFRFQVRPYDWVEFKHISLQAGQETDVQVVSPDAPTIGRR